MAAAAATPRADVVRAYRRAIAPGIFDPWRAPEEDSADGVLRLLTVTTLRLADLMYYAHLLHVYSDERDECRLARALARGVDDATAGALRLAHRALETHGRAVGYETAAWIERALEHAVRALTDVEPDAGLPVPIVLDQARRAMLALSLASTATADNAMFMAGQLATGLGHLLAVYLIATEAAAA